MPITPRVMRSDGAALPSALPAAAGRNQGSAAAAPAAREDCRASRRVIFSVCLVMVCLPFSNWSGKAAPNHGLMKKGTGTASNSGPTFARIHGGASPRFHQPTLIIVPLSLGFVNKLRHFCHSLRWSATKLSRRRRCARARHRLESL